MSGEAGVAFDLTTSWPPLLIVVGSGGVGKTTLAASLALRSAAAGHRTLVMTFDPSLRLKDALGVGREALDDIVEVPSGTPGKLYASLLDARRTFDRLVARYAPDEAARQRILNNAYYDRLAGHLGGILEYMAVERLYEAVEEGKFDRIILDTPPTSQAIDFLEAPRRIVDFLDSGALRIALKPWFAADGELERRSVFGFLGRGLEEFLDRMVGLQLLRDMSEFFRAFEPLFEGFRGRAAAAEALLADEDTLFMLVAGPGPTRIPDTLFFARRLLQAGHRLGPVVVNRLHPQFPGGHSIKVNDPEDASPGVQSTDGRALFHWLGERHQRGLEELRQLLPAAQPLLALPLTAEEPTDLESLAAVGKRLEEAMAASSDAMAR